MSVLLDDALRTTRPFGEHGDDLAVATEPNGGLDRLEVLLTTAKMIAPFVPFVAEAVWRNLTGVLPVFLASISHCH